MPKRPIQTAARLAGWLLAGLLLCFWPGCKACDKKKPVPSPWARALPRSTAKNGIHPTPDALVTIRRDHLLLTDRPRLKLRDGRFRQLALRDGADGLYLPALVQPLRSLYEIRQKVGSRGATLSVTCQPAVPFRTLRAVLYTAMQSGFTRPWLEVEGAKGRLSTIPFELPAARGGQGHDLRTSRARVPALVVGYDGKRLHVTRWGRSACPGAKPGAPAAASGCATLGTGLTAAGLRRLSAHLHQLREKRLPGRRRVSDHGVMVWSALDVSVGDLVRLLDALRTAPGTGDCALDPDLHRGTWRLRAGADQGCLYHQVVLVWSRPGHRKTR